MRHNLIVAKAKVSLNQIALLDAEIAAHEVGDRTPQAALLAWFLESVWHVETEQVPDHICDGPGDKGIDALVVDQDAREIIVFQSKRRNDPLKSTQGDVELRAFAATRDYFANLDTFRMFLASKPNDEVLKLLRRQDAEQAIEAEDYTTRLVFVTNSYLDSTGQGYVDTQEATGEPLELFTLDSLVAAAASTKRPSMRPETVKLRANSSPIHTGLTDDETIAIALIPARQLVDLPGIHDQSLFSQNVRLSLGKSAINDGLRDTIQDSTQHALFPAYHNGLTLLTTGLGVRGKTLSLEGVTVVNGCQSLTAMYNGRSQLTDSLSVLVKVVQVNNRTRVAEEITKRSNTQNAVTFRDQRSNSKPLRALQNDVLLASRGSTWMRVKSGEHAPAGSDVIENTLIAQLIMAVYLAEPYSAVRKLRLFDAEFERIFTRKIDGSKILLLVQMDKAVAAAKSYLDSSLASSFAAVRFTLLYLVGELLQLSDAGRKLLAEPQRWLVNGQFSELTIQSLEEIAIEVASGLNDHIEEKGQEDSQYDPKTAFKSRAGVLAVQQELKRDAERLARRGKGYLFSVTPSS